MNDDTAWGHFYRVLMAETSYPRATIILVGIAAAVVVAVGISELRSILAPVLLTLILTICASPVRTGLEKHGVPRGIATGSVILVVFGLLAVFTYTIIIAFAQFVGMLPNYTDEFDQIGASVTTALTAIGIDQAQVQSLAQGINPASIASAVSGALGSIASITAALVIVLTMMILMAADAVYVKTILRQLQQTRPHLVAALRSYASDVRRYMVVTTVLGVVQGTLNAIALAILQVPAALLWGLLAFLCSFIPNIGYFFAIAPPIVFGYLTGGWPTVVAVIVIYSIINAVVQSIIQPRVVGQAVSLSQSLTFFSVLFWAIVIGPIGAILAVPLTLLAKTILVDSDPRAHSWRPLLGPTAETRSILKADYAASKELRHAQSASRAAQKQTRKPDKHVGTPEAQSHAPDQQPSAPEKQSRGPQ